MIRAINRVSAFRKVLSVCLTCLSVCPQIGNKANLVPGFKFFS